MICDFCEREIPVGLALCPYCGKPQSAPSRAGRQVLWVILALGGLFALAIAEHYLFVRP
ncbi:hypothetical protein FBZ94_101345 [Bradyrhizobium sacchari]|uniref:Uncharacterized protein n=2 Tax=Bradyrhizobium sacchari TaxID=1399419 RepID=A0A560J625_9BRAD|nr:hypothetical protein FBZ94_101345 [Bradyrhizobium sacchari]TWB83904.1 hypothetical protein FBZ95_101344 [Bradyrhizobium sacchari]